MDEWFENEASGAEFAYGVGHKAAGKVRYCIAQQLLRDITREQSC